MPALSVCMIFFKKMKFVFEQGLAHKLIFDEASKMLAILFFAKVM
jgi:hypothetical protein